MSITIQISTEVQQRLLQIISKIEKELGRRASFNEAIQYLLDLQEPKVDKAQFLKNIEPFFGILKPGERKKYLKELRQLEYERDKRFHRS